jgi:acyl dehydratase
VIRAESPAQLLDQIGASALGSWHEVTQAQIGMFADATADHQWIHVDEERAKAGPYGTTIAHGLLTLSLLPGLILENVQVDGVSAVINYGADGVRFLAPVRRDSRIRLHTALEGVTAVAHGYRVTLRNSVELEGSDRPALVADTVLLFVPESDSSISPRSPSSHTSVQ